MKTEKAARHQSCYYHPEIVDQVKIYKGKQSFRKILGRAKEILVLNSQGEQQTVVVNNKSFKKFTARYLNVLSLEDREALKRAKFGFLRSIFKQTKKIHFTNEVGKIKSIYVKRDELDEFLKSKSIAREASVIVQSERAELVKEVAERLRSHFKSTSANNSQIQPLNKTIQKIGVACNIDEVVSYLSNVLKENVVYDKYTDTLFHYK